jgi:hypothetical protein
MSALITSDDIEKGREYIDDFALSFIAPLCSYYHYVLHGLHG